MLQAALAAQKTSSGQLPPATSCGNRLAAQATALKRTGHARSVTPQAYATSTAALRTGGLWCGAGSRYFSGGFGADAHVDVGLVDVDVCLAAEVEERGHPDGGEDQDRDQDSGRGAAGVTEALLVGG